MRFSSRWTSTRTELSISKDLQPSLLMSLSCTREEFVVKYIETRNKLLERREEVMRNIVDHARQ